jgi:hypothetical protein
VCLSPPQLIGLADSGSDGSRSIKTVQFDSSGTGKNFLPAKILQNGDAVCISRVIPLLVLILNRLPRIPTAIPRSSLLLSSPPGRPVTVALERIFALPPSRLLLVSATALWSHKVDKRGIPTLPPLRMMRARPPLVVPQRALRGPNRTGQPWHHRVNRI